MSSECDDICDSQPSDVSQLADENQVFTAEFKDGQLQIVEVTPFEKREKVEEGYGEFQQEYSPGGQECLQLLSEERGLHLDLLNFTLVKCGDGNTYKMVANDNAAAEGDTTTITCVLNDEVDDNQESSYVMVTEDDTDPYIYLQTETQVIEEPFPENLPMKSETTENSKAPLTPLQLLERAKKLKKARALLRSVTRRRRGRGAAPPPGDLLASPHFKLYLYSCKLCAFKCNAIKEMSAHKAAEHGAGVARAAASLQCARCPHRGHTPAQLMKHVRETHSNDAVVTKAVKLDSIEVAAADVLVCGACGFESGDRALFKKHIEDIHGATTTV